MQKQSSEQQVVNNFGDTKQVLVGDSYGYEAYRKAFDEAEDKLSVNASDFFRKKNTCIDNKG